MDARCAGCIRFCGVKIQQWVNDDIVGNSVVGNRDTDAEVVHCFLARQMGFLVRAHTVCLFLCSL